MEVREKQAFSGKEEGDDTSPETSGPRAGVP